MVLEDTHERSRTGQFALVLQQRLAPRRGWGIPRRALGKRVPVIVVVVVVVIVVIHAVIVDYWLWLEGEETNFGDDLLRKQGDAVMGSRPLSPPIPSPPMKRATGRGIYYDHRTSMFALPL